VRYLHSEIETVERVEIIRDCGWQFDVLVGINLLREGLDCPRCRWSDLDDRQEGVPALGALADPDIGRAARH